MYLNSTYFDDLLKYIPEPSAPSEAAKTMNTANKVSAFGNEIIGTVGDSLETTNAVETENSLENASTVISDAEFDESYKKFMEETPKNRFSREEAAVKYKNKSLSASDLKDFAEKEEQYVQEDCERLKKIFSENPEMREKYQENFDKLDVRTQKAVLAEVYTSNRKLDEDEINRLINGVKSADDEVKFKVFSVLRNDERVTPEQYGKLAKKLEIDKQMLDIIDKLHEKYENGSHDKVKTAIIAKDIANSNELKTNEISKFANEITEFQDDSELQFAMGKELINSKSIKADEAAKNAIINTLPKYTEDNQVRITKTAYESENFDSTALRNSIISQVKYFSASNQKLASEYILSSEKTNLENTNFLKNEIKSFDETVQNEIKNSLKQAAEKAETSNKSNVNVNKSVKNPGVNAAAQNAIVNKGTARPTNLVGFVDALKKGVYSVSQILKVRSSAIYDNISALGREEQIEAIYAAPVETLASMCTSGKLSGALYELAMQRVKTSGNIDGKTATLLASSLSYKELKEIVSGNDKISDGIKEYFKNALNKRFSGLLEIERAQNERFA